MAKKSFDELNLNDAFLFASALQDGETCRLILEIILGKPVEKVRVHTEHGIFLSPDLRSIRLDVYATDELQVGYNVEMQKRNRGNLPQRSRFYQAQIDVGALKPGEDFQELKPSYVIFICTFDPFDHNLYRYTFEERCLERDFALKDGTRKIFLSTKGTNRSEVPKELVEFLRYVEDSSETCAKEAKDERIEKLHERISALKKSRKWRAGYMTIGELLDDSREEGRTVGLQEGRTEGQDRTLELMDAMIANGDGHLLSRLKDDRELLAQMYEKYHI